jgi:methylase of polypeptide subunit release factors
LQKSYNLIRYYRNLLKKLNYKFAFLCDNIDAKIKLERCISGNFINDTDLILAQNTDAPRNAKKITFKKSLNNIDTVFIVRHFSIGGRKLKSLVDEIKRSNKKDIAIFDQSAHIWECWSQKNYLNFYFRKIILNVSKNKLIPSYYYNDAFIDKIIEIIKKKKYKSVIDMCCGSGVIGLSILKETKLKKLILSDIDISILKSIKTSLKLNKLSNSSVKFLVSDGFKKFKKNDKSDLIVLNPPFVNQEITSHNHLNGHDPEWKFSIHFFRNASNFLNAGGKILFIKPRDIVGNNVLLDSDVKYFIKNTKLQLKEKINIRGTHYCILILCLKK